MARRLTHRLFVLKCGNRFTLWNSLTWSLGTSGSSSSVSLPALSTSVPPCKSARVFCVTSITNSESRVIMSYRIFRSTVAAKLSTLLTNKYSLP